MFSIDFPDHVGFDFGSQNGVKLVQKSTYPNRKNLDFAWSVFKKRVSGTFLRHPKCVQTIVVKINDFSYVPMNPENALKNTKMTIFDHFQMFPQNARDLQIPRSVKMLQKSSYTPTPSVCICVGVQAFATAQPFKISI